MVKNYRSKEKNNIGNVRNSSIELLRIISMIMIIFHHFACHGGFNWGINELTIPHFWYNFIVMGGKIGVDIFVLISGYFLINNSGKLSYFVKILKFWGEVFFYSVFIYIIFGLLGVSEINVTSFLKACFPITFESWWFASTYFILYLIHPFLNKLLNSLEKKTYQNFLLIIIIYWSVIPTLMMQNWGGNNLLGFIVLYAIAGYVRKFGFNEKYGLKQWFLLWIIFSMFTYLLSSILMGLGSNNQILYDYHENFYLQNKLTVLLISFTLFMTFVSLKIRYNKIINTVASAAFAVYLISDSNTVRPFLWQNVFKIFQYQNSNMLIPYSMIVVAVVYIGCTIIDLIRQKVFEKTYIYMINKYSKKWLERLEQILSVCKSAIFGKN